MKFATLAGLVSATSGNKFLEINEEVMNFSSTSITNTKAWKALHKIDH